MCLYVFDGRRARDAFRFLSFPDRRRARMHVCMRLCLRALLCRLLLILPYPLLLLLSLLLLEEEKKIPIWRRQILRCSAWRCARDDE